MGWIIEVYDISKRWGAVDGGGISTSMPKNVPFHFWTNRGDETFEEICGVLQVIEDYDKWDGGVNYPNYKNRPKRIRDKETGDIMPLEVLNIQKRQVEEPEEDQAQAALMNTLKKNSGNWSAFNGGSAALPPKDHFERSLIENNTFEKRLPKEKQ